MKVDGRFFRDGGPFLARAPKEEFWSKKTKNMIVFKWRFYYETF